MDQYSYIARTDQLTNACILKYANFNVHILKAVNEMSK